MNEIVLIAVPRPLHATYEYRVPADMGPLARGSRVSVPFGRSTTIGICVATGVPQSHPKLKDVLEILDPTPLVSEHLLDLAQWMTDYYHYPLGEVLSTLLPVAARRGVATEIEPPNHFKALDPGPASRAKAQLALYQHLIEHGPQAPSDLIERGFKRETLRALEKGGHVERCDAARQIDREPPPQPVPEQLAAIEAIQGALGTYETFLLQGITGSGKTEVYLRAIEHALERGEQTLVLVPEIALTPQTLSRFRRRFARVGMLHSNLTDRERLQTWLKTRAGQLDVLIGTRSAVFTEFARLGLIVVDEEHDASYKQQEGLRYSARDIAAKRAHALGIPLVLGSATPSLETLNNARLARYRTLHLTTRATGARLPSYHLIDMRGQSHTDGISVPLEHVMRRHLEADGQVLVFLNRRGYAPTLLCGACGWQAVCTDCDARLTLHRSPPRLICHHCTLSYEIARKCEACGHEGLIPVGLGTQRTEAGLDALFPEVPVMRIDRDTTRSNKALENRLNEINQGTRCIMVGTQMLAKGHHFPNVTLVAVLNADAGFLSPDFRAPERTAQLIVQVAGRAGREARPGEVWIQTYKPDNPQLFRLLEDGYAGFAAAELDARISAGLPPAQAMAIIRAEALEPERALGLLKELKQSLAGVQCLGPTPAPLSRKAGWTRYQLLLLAPSRARLHAALSRLPHSSADRTLRWGLDVDPYDAF